MGSVQIALSQSDNKQVLTNDRLYRAHNSILIQHQDWVETGARFRNIWLWWDNLFWTFPKVSYWNPQFVLNKMNKVLLDFYKLWIIVDTMVTSWESSAFEGKACCCHGAAGKATVDPSKWRLLGGGEGRRRPVKKSPVRCMFARRPLSQSLLGYWAADYTGSPRLLEKQGPPSLEVFSEWTGVPERCLWVACERPALRWSPSLRKRTTQDKRSEESLRLQTSDHS